MDTASEERPETTVIVVTGGDPPERDVLVGLPPGGRVVAADSGADTALALGLVVHDLVGDLDSVSPPGLQRLVDGGASIEAHEPDKDATDLELALAAALLHHPDRILVFGGLGGRVDHELANLLLLAGGALREVDVVLRSGAQTVSVVRPGRPTTLRGKPGDLASILAVHGTARGVTTSGLRWSLTGADLAPGSTVGVSNELVGDEASVSCTGGVALVVQPGLAAPFVPTRSTTPTVDERGPR